MEDARSSKELLRAAFLAIMKGDRAERDRMCGLAKVAVDREEAEVARLRKMLETDSVTTQ